MNTAIENEEDKKEYFDSIEDLDFKVEQLAIWIKESKHFVAFTGAGVSTGAGIADFRSGKNTVLETGPGAWERKAQNITQAPKVSVSSIKAYPTKCHMSLVKLMDEGLLKYLISQNTDGLHRKSGVPPEKISELHGNTNKEKCIKCDKEYLRDYRTRTAKTAKEHQTGRFCEVKGCGGQLMDTIINFNESLPESPMNLGFYHSQVADLHLVMGSSLRVTPAADMPDTTTKAGGKLVIVNLQKTPLDDIAAMVIHAKIDDFMILLMKKLNLKIPEWKITRRVLFKIHQNSTLKIRSVDIDGTPQTTFEQIDIIVNGKKQSLQKEPFEFRENFQGSKEFQVILKSFGYYNEPDLKLTIDANTLLDLKVYLLEYNPFINKWEDVTALDYFDEFD